MKKLAMMALVLSMGIAANAAVTQWSLAAFYTPNGVDGSGNVVLDMNTSMSWIGGNYHLYIVNQATGHEGELVEVSVSPTISAGSLAATTLFDQDTSVSMRDTYGKSDYLYMKIVGSYSDGSYDYSYDSGVLSKNLRNITGSTGQKFTFSGAGIKWTATPVPEPTSGLLLILGVAGMALRRRRA